VVYCCVFVHLLIIYVWNYRLICMEESVLNSSRISRYLIIHHISASGHTCSVSHMKDRFRIQLGGVREERRSEYLDGRQ
jgi:hypothetical protein